MKAAKQVSIGILLIVAFNALSAAKEVYVAHLLQAAHPIVVLSFTFSITALFFLALEVRSFDSYIQSLRRQSVNVLLLNITTMVSWMSFFMALKFMEPAVADAIGFALGPILTIMLWRVLRPDRPATRSEVIAAIGILIGVLLLLGSTWIGRSAVGHISLNNNLLGLACSLLCGLAVVGNTIFSKRLSDHGMTARRIMAQRFLLLIVSGIALWPASVQLASITFEFIGIMLLIALLGVIVPLYLLQLGIERCEPVTVSLLLSCLPAFSLLLQLFDPRLSVSYYSVAGIILCVGFTGIGVISRIERSPQ